MKYNKPPLTLPEQLNHIKNQYNIDCNNTYKLSHTLLVMKLLLKPIKQDNILKDVLNLANSYKIPLEKMGLNKLILKALQ